LSENSVKIRIMDTICAANGPSSKKSIREATGFAWNTVGRIVDRLVMDRLLLEVRDDPTRPGRPITHLELNPENPLIVGLALGGNWWRLVLCDFSFNSLFDAKIPTPEWNGADHFFKSIREFLFTSLEKAGCFPDRLFGVGVACSGNIDPDNGVLVSALNMGVKAGVHLPLQKELESMLKKPVLISNSTVATAWSEYHFGANSGIRNLLTVGISIGIGAGVVINGKPLAGSPDRPVGTIGHVYIPGNHRQCVCGRTGCLEAFSGGRSLVKVCKERYPETNWQSAEEIDRAAADGDARAQSVLQRAAKLDAACIAFLVQMYRPEVLIFTGGQCIEGGFFYSVLCKKMLKVLPKDVVDSLKISISSIKEYGNALGAARLAFEKFF